MKPDLVIEAVTDAYAAATMTTREDIVGHSLFEVFPDNPDENEGTGVANLRSSLMTVLKTRRPHTMAVQKYDIRRPDSEGGGFETRYWSPVNVPVLGPGGEVSHIIHRVEDVTEFIRLEQSRNGGASGDFRGAAEVVQRAQEIQILNRELDRTVRALGLAKEAADRANTSKSEFLSRMSHELRTPLNAILGFAQLLDLTATSSQDREHLHQILKGGRHLLALVNDVMDLSRVETGQVTFSTEPIHIQEIVAESKALIQPLAASLGIQIVDHVESTEALWVEADRQRLRQILVNLLSNSVKYNGLHGSVDITARSVDGTVEIDCADTGTGIAPDKVDRLFLPFDRLDAETSSIEGTGLGLALSKRLAVSMGSDISYLPNPSGPGSVFRVTLKQTSVAHRESVATSQLPELAGLAPALAGKKILYVEDNLSNIRLMEGIMAKWPGAQLLVSQQGRMGVDLALEHHPDIILLDLHLPDIPGQKVMEALRAHPSMKNTPIIILSADATERQMSAIKEAGAFAYVTKPFQLTELAQVIAEAVSAR